MTQVKGVYETVRAHGGVCVADEVQTGFGRCGSHYWGFETHGVKETGNSRFIQIQ